MNNRRAFLFASLLSILFVSGCATQGAKPVLGDEYAALMDSAPSEVLLGMVPSSYEEAIKKADEGLRAGELDKALFMYLQALGHKGDPVYPLYRVGLIHQQRGNKDLAILAFQKVLELDEEHYLAQENLGILYLKKRQHDLARQALADAIDTYDRLERDAAIAASTQIEGQEQKPRRDTSIKPLRAYNGLGVIFDLKRNFEQAQIYYRKIISAQPKSPAAYNNLGYSYYLAGDWGNAEKSYRSAISFNDDYGQAWNNLGLVLARQSKYQQAVQAFARTMDLARAYNDVGYLAMVDGNYEKAELLLAEAIRLFPRYYETAQKNYADNQARWADAREASANLPLP